MGKDEVEPKVDLAKSCPKTLLSSYPVLYPICTTFSFKNLKSAINFNVEDKEPCNKTWYRDVKSTHIRNKQLVDLPLRVPKCCYDAYSANIDRQKQKKLQKFGFTYSGRVPNCSKQPEVENENICSEETREDKPAKITLFPECYLLKDSESENEEDEEYKTCSSGSESECSACSTLGGGTRKKLHKVVKKDWRGLLHRPEDPCKEIAQEELRKHKSRQFFSMKVKKLLNK